MLNVAIFILLAVAFYSGSRRGFTMQLVYTAGYLISFFVAKMYYKELGERLELFIPYPSISADTNLVFFDIDTALDLDKAFYAGVAFIIILVIGWIVTRFIGVFAHGLTFIPVLKQLDWLAGGAVSVLVMYVGIFLVLSLVAMIPMDMFQNLFKDGSFAHTIVEKTPIFSKQIQNLWVTQIIK